MSSSDEEIYPYVPISDEESSDEERDPYACSTDEEVEYGTWRDMGAYCATSKEDAWAALWWWVDELLECDSGILYYYIKQHPERGYICL